jgi:Fe-S cluster assembly protein SufD
MAALEGPDWLTLRRTEALEAFGALPPPSEKEEVWRYSPIDELDLDGVEPSPGDGLDDADRAFVRSLSADMEGVAAWMATCGGRVLDRSPGQLGAGVVLDGMAAAEEGLGTVVTGGDALVRLNDAFHPDVVVLEVPAGVRLPGPVLVVHRCPAAVGGRPAASFPRTLVRLGAGAEAQVIEVLAGADGPGRPLVVPVVELEVGPGARLDHLGVQVLGGGAWCLARLGARIDTDATLRAFGAGLGGAYARSRTDAAAVGKGAHSQLRSVYLGTGTQVHDVRTLQDHEAPRTTSDLLCQGAVADASRSVYSGLIRIRRGATRAEAMQTNHNLVLDPRAHADSVPNLDIEENDVRCSHASTVGPVDEDQRFYLESRGIAPGVAERLIVAGFFDALVDEAPVAAAVPRLRQEVGLRLAAALEGQGGTGG